MTFGTPDRPVLCDYLYYDSTRKRWVGEGLPADVPLDDYFGFDKLSVHDDVVLVGVGAGITPFPAYEEKILEEDDTYRLEQTSSGAVVRRRKDIPPPAMPQHVSFPVQGRDSWKEYRKRLDPHAPGRLPPDLGRFEKQWKNRDHPLGIWVGSSYGIIRNWMGVEGVSYTLYDDPALFGEMIEYLTYYYCETFKMLTAGIKVDWCMFWEDLAGKQGPLISPQMYAELCLPLYRAVVDLIRRHGCDVIGVDSDGNVWDMIPLWLDAGINVLHPMEVAAGMDVISARRKYGKALAFWGGIDKRELAKDRAAIDREVLPKLELMEEGGFLVECDHAVPPDISFENFCYYRELVRQKAEDLRD